MAGVAVVVVSAIVVSLVAAAVGIFIYDNCALPCECPSIAEAEAESRCKVIPLFMKVPLIATHLLAFILMPASMCVSQAGASVLQQRLGMKSPVQMVLGLAYIMLSIAGEVGWHVHQRWFYHEDYDVLNYFFYAFITLGTSLWALGAQTEATKSALLDALLMLCTPLATLVYAWGAYANTHGLGGASKVPIYIIMMYQYLVLSWRLFKLLNNDYTVWLFPVFSVGVNLFFIFLLDQFQSHVILNPLFHMLHDAAGTEMGVLIITIIVWNATSSTSSQAAVAKKSS